MAEPNRTGVPIVGTARRLKSEKKYGDALLFSWGLTELEIDSLLRQKLEFGNSKIENTSFTRKIDALKQAGCFSGDDERKILHFKQKRDAVFHSYTNTMMWASGDEGKDELADIAINALEACTHAFTRSLTPVRGTKKEITYMLSFDTVEPNTFRERHKND